MGHDAGDAHLGGTAVVQLDGALVLLPLIGLLVPVEVRTEMNKVRESSMRVCVNMMRQCLLSSQQAGGEQHDI